MLGTICTWIVGFYFLGYLIPHIFVVWFFKTKNLKKSYNATWALVTGSSSGASISIIYRAINPIISSPTAAPFQLTKPLFLILLLPLLQGLAKHTLKSSLARV